MRKKRGIGGGWGAPLGLALLAACPPKGAKVQSLAADEFRATGTVSRTTVGTNCWRFAASDGRGYELRPEQAPAEVLADGRQFTLVLKRRTDLTSICMVGELVDVIRVEPDPSQ